ncbi:MAG: translation initiation factor IF-3 [Verrucomicrobia bacterium]|nr:translation initiation factor IF-3 [Verrucomicrobiota bacterium]
MSRPFSPRHPGPSNSAVRVNGKIRAREVRVIAVDGRQLGVIALHEAINMARSQGVDLVEVASTATPPVCKLIDFGKFRYEQAKKDKESRKHQHANKVKEIQLSPSIDPHDFGVKLGRAVDFLCEEMKVKIALRFRGREMAHQEFGFQVVRRFLGEVAPYGHADAEPKLIGRGINVMISPLPRNKRAKNPHENASAEVAEGAEPKVDTAPVSNRVFEVPVASPTRPVAPSPPKPPASGFANNPFASLDLPAPGNA